MICPPQRLTMRNAFHTCVATVSFGLLFFSPTALASRTEARAQMERFEQAIDAWDLDKAHAELQSLEKVIPEGSEPLSYFEGRIAFEEGRYAEAVDHYTHAGIVDRPGSQLHLAKDTLSVVNNDARQESEHFILFYPKGKDEVLVPWALETLEAARTGVERMLGYAPPGKVRVEIVNDAMELSKVSTLTHEQIETTGTIAICKFNKLMITSPKAVVRGYDWRDTLTHEYVHLVVTRKSQNTVPIWLHEGLAKYLESVWRADPGAALNPSSLSLLGQRVKADKLIAFEKMHPSIALLPSKEDAATAFAEVFFAVDLLYRQGGKASLQTVIEKLREGQSDQKAVEAASGMRFSQFEKAWLAHVRKQPFPKDLIPLTDEKKVLSGKGKNKEEPEKGKGISFGYFKEVTEPDARKAAHLGELFRERKRHVAATEAYARAYKLVGNKYESVSNKYARALVEAGQPNEAEKVLLNSLRVHPSIATTHVQLGRLRLQRKDFPGAEAAYVEALDVDPFDPEVHLALTLCYRAQGKKALAERSLKAAALLTGRTLEKVEPLLKEPM